MATATAPATSVSAAAIAAAATGPAAPDIAGTAAAITGSEIAARAPAWPWPRTVAIRSAPWVPVVPGIAGQIRERLRLDVARSAKPDQAYRKHGRCSRAYRFLHLQAVPERLTAKTGFCACQRWQVGHQKTFRPSSSLVRIVVPHTRHASPARR